MKLSHIDVFMKNVIGKRISEYKDKTIVLVQYEDQKEKRTNKNEQSLRDL